MLSKSANSEFYTDKTSGEEKPGKKGIALSPEDCALPTLELTGVPRSDTAQGRLSKS